MEQFTQEQVNELRREADLAYLVYANIKEQYQSAETDWLKKSRRFKDADYKLALVDGRLKKIASTQPKKLKEPPTLTLEQLKSIAATLGVSITVEEPEENEEVIETIAEETSNDFQNN